MADINVNLKKALNGVGPQHKISGKNGFEFADGSDGAGHVKITDTKGTPIDPREVSDASVLAKLADVEARQNDILARMNGEFSTQLTGSNLEQQLTETDAVSGVLTFSDAIHEIEVYNRSSSDGTFTVNGIGIIVPAGEVFQAKIGGTPSKNVSVSGSTSYVVGRYA